MFRKKLLVAGFVCIGGSVGFAADAPATSTPTPQELMDRLKALQSQVNDLRAKQDAVDPANQRKTSEQVIEEADRHSALLDEGGVTAGYANRRFFIQSDDGNFVLRPWIHLQIRESTAWREDFKHSGADDVQNGFEIRRARLGFDGNLFSPDFTYFINWATFRGNGSLTVKSSTGATVGTTASPVGGLPVLEEAWVKYHFHDTPWYIHLGQMHDPLDHENIVGSKYRQPEASLQGDIFGNTDTFTQAATIIYDPKTDIRFEGGVTDGIRAANTNFEDYPNNGIEYDGGVAGRAEYKVFGNWKDYDQLTSYGNKKNLLVLGAGVDDSWGGDFNQLSHTLDLQYAQPNGFFAYVCYFGRYTNHNPGIPNGAPVSTSFGATPDLGKDTYEPSIDVLCSYLINQRLEPFVRYEYLHLAGTPAGSQNNVNDISVGANYYFWGHNIKATGMLTYLPNGIPVNDDSADVLISNDKGELVFIAQLQLLL